MSDPGFDPPASALKTIREAQERARQRRMNMITLYVTVASTLIALAAAGAAFWSGYEAHKARIEDERPFISIDIIQPDDKQPQAHEVPFFLETRSHDIGKTPARYLRATCFTGMDSATAPVRWPTPNPQFQTFPYVLPDHYVDISCPAPDGYAPTKNLHSIEIGFVEYQDAHANPYRTPFCFHFGLASNNNIDVQECSQSRGLPELR
jgi:hypothetical protein